MLYLRPPEDFKPKFEAVGCYIEYQERFLLLHRNDHGNPEVDLWGQPAGKIEHEETPLEAARRETREETGLDIPLEDIQYFKKTYVRFPRQDFIYHICTVKLIQKPELVLNKKIAHSFAWATSEEALKMRLIEDDDVCFKMIKEKEKAVSDA